ncbi:hypothetical protein CEXT_442041 [Caerostris extrusa]|uniref:Uncharacterized protein n=1 Tax=Caerostris extrusa TaxID=172846 RepID=A0AAV4XVT9_CAEEX|nr:hypothetical protein CEXT_442041 [Caerostris extrusa]
MRMPHPFGCNALSIQYFIAPTRNHFQKRTILHENPAQRAVTQQWMLLRETHVPLSNNKSKNYPQNIKTREEKRGKTSLEDVCNTKTRGYPTQNTRRKEDDLLKTFVSLIPPPWLVERRHLLHRPDRLHVAGHQKWDSCKYRARGPSRKEIVPDLCPRGD